MRMADKCRHITAPSVIDTVREHFLHYRVFTTLIWHCFWHMPKHNAWGDGEEEFRIEAIKNNTKIILLPLCKIIGLLFKKAC